jgi:hypothetical protein
MEEILVLKQRRNVGKPLLSLLLAIMLVMQTVMFSTAAYAESVPNDTEVGAVSEPDSSIVDEETSEETVNEPETPIVDESPSVSEEVQDVPDNSIMMTAAPTDKTSVFMGTNSSFPLEVKQGDTVIDPNGIIKGRQPFTLKSEGLKIPVNGDDSNPTNADAEQYIQKGDWIELKREDYFKEVILPTATKALMAQTESGTRPLGTAMFTPNSIRIVFDGDDDFFNGVRRGIVISLETTAEADVKGLAYGEKKPVDIFGSTYQLENPDVTAEYSINLISPGMVKWDQYSYRVLQLAQFVEGAVTWQSTVTASDKFDKTIKLPLDGKTFYTNPSAYNTLPGNSRGIYVEGSFKVNDQNVTPDVGEDGSLTYIFPSGTGPEPKVEYKTWIPKESYYFEYRNPPGNLGRSHRDTNGKVELRQDNSMLVQAGLEITFAPDWIQSSASYDHASETITWRVTANRYNKNGLKDFTITNVLPTGLNFLSAEWQEEGAGSGVTPITPDANGVYSFGNINGKVDLVIKSKVVSGSSFRIDPRANWNLDTPAGIQNNDVKAGKWPVAVTDEAIVNIGAHDFTKSSAVSIEDYNQGSITWTVDLAPQYALPNAAVYDVLVHGGNLDVLDNALDVSGEVSAETIAKIKANVTSAQLWKQYKAGTLKTSAANLTMKAIPLTVDGKVVADLIKVTGYTDSSASFSFRALETNPDILFRQDINAGKTSTNRALLIDGESVRQAQNNANLHLRMLNKDMLFASRPLKVDGTLENVSPNNVNSYIRNDNNEAWTISAYDRTTKTVTFRLGVNMPGYNTEEMAKDGGNRVISNIKLVDTLPEGWEFVPFSEGKDYELWKGLSDNGAGAEYGTRNDAKSVIEPGTAAHVVSSFTHNGNVGTFTFSKLESPYVILVKARPSNEALEEYLNEYTTSGTDKQVLYNKANLHMSWGGVEKTVSEQRKIIVPIQTLGKSVTKPVPGVLEWTVNYTPPFNMKQGVYLEDTLGAGMNLRYEENGDLVLSSPSMAVYPAKLTASGKLEREDTAINLSDPNAEVQVEVAPGPERTTVLKFKMKDPNKFYQFVYQTEVDPTTAKAGDKMGNEVKLEGDDSLSAVSARSESTLDSSDVAGSSSSNALLPLIKVDPNGNPLKDVEFTLYKKDTGTIVVKGKTDSLGKRNLLFPDPGYYELKETYIDTNTWLPTTRVYQVYVGNTPGKPIWVDGVKVTSDQPLVVPTPAQGKLTITNKVEGNGSDPNKGFVYTVTFTGEGKDGEYSYKKSDNTSGTLKNGDKITLKHGESVMLPALPANLGYTVTEDDYTTVDGYTTTPATRELSGSIVNKGDHKADFINERIVNKLTISNTVMGNGGDKTKEFEYTIHFENTGKDESYSYMKSDGSAGTIKSGDIFRLKDGETLNISGLPKNLKYTVNQKDYTTDEYMTTPEERYYTEVMKGKDEEAPFTNVRVLKGGLLISNVVKGKDDDKKKLFKYTVDFTGEGADESYVYEKSDGSKGMIKNGDSFELTDGQTLVVQGLPASLEYKVTQDDYTKDGFVTDPERFVRTGVIPEKKAAEAKFMNTRPYLEGVLRDNNTGEVIPNASITVTDLNTGEELQIKTNEKGEYAVPAVADTDYTITYTKVYRVGGKDVPVKFTQKANVNSSVTDETVPADITAVGIILLKQMDGTTELFNNLYTSHMYIYLKDRDGNYIMENGSPKAFPMASNGTFSVEGLSEQKYTMEVRYQVETGEELLLKVTQLDVKANGELNISEELVDPYGTVYDETTGNASTGKKIEGAKVTLYYADTQRNRDKGRIPGTKVTLPAVPNFPPHDNKSPEQDSDANGFYAYMVFPEADYYLVVTKDGYETHTSGTISVDFDIVKYDVPMKPIRSGGGTGGGNNGNSGTDNGTPGTNTGTPGTNTDNSGTNTGTPGTNTDNSGTNTGTPETNTDNSGTNTGTPETNTDNSGTNTGTPETNTDNSETNTGTPETNTDNSGTNAGTPETNNSNGGANTGSNETGSGNNELDDAPKTGDNSISPMSYMILALMSLITIVFCLLGNKKKKHI